MEIYSLSGVCLSGIQALKTGYLAVATGDKPNAVCCASELPSPCLLSKNYDEEYENAHNLGKEPFMAFEKEFLRFMLSDGAGAVLMENFPREEKSLKIEWIDMASYAHELPACMFMGAERLASGELKGWKEIDSRKWINEGIFVLKQDIRLLKEFIIKYCVKHLASNQALLAYALHWRVC